MCTYDIDIRVQSAPRDNPLYDELANMLFDNDEDFATAKTNWPSLFDTTIDEGLPNIPSVSCHLTELIFIILNNRGSNLYRNGAVKAVLQQLMRLGSDDKGSHNCFVRVSTTNDPTSDTCGLVCAATVHSTKREDALNG